MSSPCALHDLAPISLRSRPEPASTALPCRYNTYCSPYCSRPYVLQPTTVHEGACGCDGGVAVWGGVCARMRACVPQGQPGVRRPARVSFVNDCTEYSCIQLVEEASVGPRRGVGSGETVHAAVFGEWAEQRAVEVATPQGAYR